MKNRDAEIGFRIKAERLFNGLTQKQLAERMGVSQTAIALWENGSRSISIDIAEDLAEILGISASYILFGESEDTKTSEPAPKNKPVNANTIAAHFDGAEFTEEELEEIRAYADFIKSRRQK